MRILIPKQAALRKRHLAGAARMIRLSWQSPEHLKWSYNIHSQSSSQSSKGLLSIVSISRLLGDLTPATIDQAQRAKMTRNPRRELQFLLSRKSLMPKTELDTLGYCFQSGCSLKSQTYAIHSPNARKVRTHSFTPVRNLQGSRNVQAECLLLDGSGTLSEAPSRNDAVVEENTKLEGDRAKVNQEFDYIVVVDFEATCDKHMENFDFQEIIEFPSVLINCQCLTLDDCFQTYVKPVHRPILTSFCVRLTGIQQEQVDKGVTLIEALERHDQWLQERGVKDKKFAVLIWSDWDCKVMLESECRRKGLKRPSYFERWINLKVFFQSAFMGRRLNLKRAVEAAGLRWTGRAHCGLDDATNTARLALELMRRGTILKLTSSSGLDYNPQTVATTLRRPHWPGSNLQSMSGGDNVQNPKIACNSVEVDSLVCFCGIHSRKCMVAKPGPTYGKFFFVCGKWTTAGNRCKFFEWASS